MEQSDKLSYIKVLVPSINMEYFSLLLSYLAPLPNKEEENHAVCRMTVRNQRSALLIQVEARKIMSLNLDESLEQYKTYTFQPQVSDLQLAQQV